MSTTEDEQQGDERQERQRSRKSGASKPSGGTARKQASRSRSSQDEPSQDKPRSSARRASGSKEGQDRPERRSATRRGGVGLGELLGCSLDGLGRFAQLLARSGQPGRDGVMVAGELVALRPCDIDLRADHALTP